MVPAPCVRHGTAHEEGFYFRICTTLNAQKKNCSAFFYFLKQQKKLHKPHSNAEMCKKSDSWFLILILKLKTSRSWYWFWIWKEVTTILAVYIDLWGGLRFLILEIEFLQSILICSIAFDIQSVRYWIWFLRLISWMLVLILNVEFETMHNQYCLYQYQYTLS